MKTSPDDREAKRPRIFSGPAASADDVIFLNHKDAEEPDSTDDVIPDEEIIDPKPIPPIGDFRNERPSNVDGAEPGPDVDDIEKNDAGDDEAALTPITPRHGQR